MLHFGVDLASAVVLMLRLEAVIGTEVLTLDCCLYSTDEGCGLLCGLVPREFLRVMIAAVLGPLVYVRTDLNDPCECAICTNSKTG